MLKTNINTTVSRVVFKLHCPVFISKMCYKVSFLQKNGNLSANGTKVAQPMSSSRTWGKEVLMPHLLPHKLQNDFPDTW